METWGVTWCGLCKDDAASASFTLIPETLNLKPKKPSQRLALISETRASLNP